MSTRSLAASPSKLWRHDLDVSAKHGPQVYPVSGVKRAKGEADRGPHLAGGRSALADDAAANDEAGRPQIASPLVRLDVGLGSCRNVAEQRRKQQEEDELDGPPSKRPARRLS